MGAGAMEGNGMSGFVNLVDENPVVIQDMAINTALPYSVQGMRFTAFRQGLFGNNETHHLAQIVHIPSTLF
jgi:hypothetical protein